MTRLASSSHPAMLAVFTALWVASSLPVQASETPTAAPRAASDATASTPKRRVDKPLRFDPPAAGPARTHADYEACIDQPSPDGAACDCSALLPQPAKPRK